MDEEYELEFEGNMPEDDFVDTVLVRNTLGDVVEIDVPDDEDTEVSDNAVHD